MKKFESKKGFTLAELLIVVAIIAVLVAVSIPIFTSKLEKAREATDIANLRAAKAAAVTSYLGDDTIDGVVVGSKQADTVTLYYDASNGVLKSSADGITSYGKGTAATGDANNTMLGYNPAAAAKNYVTVTIAVDGVTTVSIQ